MPKLYLGNREVTPEISAEMPITDISKSNYLVKTDGSVELLQNNSKNLPLFQEVIEHRENYDYLNNSTIKVLNCSAIKDVGGSSIYNTNNFMFRGCTSLTKVDFSSLESCGTRSFYDHNNGGAFNGCTSLSSIDFSSLKSVGNSGFDRGFTNTAIVTASFPLVETVNNYGFAYAFPDCKALTTVSFPLLKTANYASFGLSFLGCSNLTTVNFDSLEYMDDDSFVEAFEDCTSLENISFPKLSYIVKFGFADAFGGCTSLKNVYFNSLTTHSFEDPQDAYTGLLADTGTDVVHTLHFPSNLQPTIAQLEGYPLFGGDNGYVVLAFDLPATE